MVDKQNKTLLINSVMRSMSFSVLSNKEILGGQCDWPRWTPKHIEALDSFFKVHQQWLWFLVKLQGFCSCFSDVPIQGKKTSPKSKIQVNHPVSRPKTSFRAQVEQREIFVKTNDEKILKHLGLFTIYN